VDGYDDRDAMRDSLKEINMLLRQGLKLSRLGSYQRRAPDNVGTRTTLVPGLNI